MKILSPTIQAPDMAHQHARIDDVIVNDEVVRVLDERPVHMREPVDSHQQHAEIARFLVIDRYSGEVT